MTNREKLAKLCTQGTGKQSKYTTKKTKKMNNTGTTKKLEPLLALLFND
jgi:hypothetical protein